MLIFIFVPNGVSLDIIIEEVVNQIELLKKQSDIFTPPPSSAGLARLEETRYRRISSAGG